MEAHGEGQLVEVAEEELERVPVAAEEFNPDECPIHHEVAHGQNDTEMRPLYCPRYKDQKCEWQRKDFVNTDEDTGAMTKVTKYRITKGKGTFMFLETYLDELRHRNLIT